MPIRRSNSTSKKAEPYRPRSPDKRAKNQAKQSSKAMKNIDSFAFFVALFASMSSGGTPPSRVVNILYNQTEEKGLKKALGHINESLSAGEGLEKAFVSSGYFPQDFCNVLGIGDRTGSLPVALKSYSDYLRQVVTLKKSFKSTLMYPSILIGMISMMFVGAIYFGLPQMKKMALSSGTAIEKLPGFIQTLFAFGDLMEHINMYFVIGLMVLWIWYIIIGPGKDQLISLISRVFPPVKAIDEKLRWSQWLTLCSMCIRQGAKMSDVMEFLKGGDLPKEFSKKGEYERICANYRSGIQLGDELRRVKAPELIAGTLGVAEQQGELDHFMKLVADSFLDTMVFNIKEAGSAVEVAILVLTISVGGALAGTLMITMITISSAVQ